MRGTRAEAPRASARCTGSCCPPRRRGPRPGRTAQRPAGPRPTCRDAAPAAPGCCARRRTHRWAHRRRTRRRTRPRTPGTAHWHSAFSAHTAVQWSRSRRRTRDSPRALGEDRVLRVAMAHRAGSSGRMCRPTRAVGSSQQARVGQQLSRLHRLRYVFSTPRLRFQPAPHGHVTAAAPQRRTNPKSLRLIPDAQLFNAGRHAS